MNQRKQWREIFNHPESDAVTLVCPDGHEVSVVIPTEIRGQPCMFRCPACDKWWSAPWNPAKPS